MTPIWLVTLSIASLGAAACCAALIAIDEWRDPQHMWIMNIVWPVSALFGSVLILVFYFSYGTLASRSRVAQANSQGRGMPSKSETPFWLMVAKGACHCGTGCALGDIIAEWLAVAFPVIAVWLGWRTIFAEKMFAVWVLDYIFAFVIGIAFQYFTIKPARDLSPAAGLKQAVKADTLSLTAWQVGMYGFMALAYFWIFPSILGARLEVATPQFWFMMQIAMLLGFATAYPVNWWLIRSGIKERM
ncbi:MAG: DUF4396 domain-containing protein [Proteobacteria bacterium]|nr:DUF4396 domain-containing protein [Pseudomonadota bacterium]